MAYRNSALVQGLAVGMIRLRRVFSLSLILLFGWVKNQEILIFLEKKFAFLTDR